MRALHVQDLVDVTCGNPQCPDGGHPIYITPRCHPQSGVEVAFDKQRLALLVQCHTCKAPICDIAVATAITH